MKEPTMSLPFPNHPFLTGIFAPISFEADAYDLPVRGEVPKDLRGTLYRNSPNPQFAPRDDNYHWFVGDGMIHAFHINDGHISYRNRWVQTPKFLAERAAHRALFGSWGNPMTSDPSVRGKDGGVANTSIIIHAGKVFAAEEGHLPFAIDPGTIGSQGYWDFGGALTTGRFTAHPKIDPATGEMVFFGYSVGGYFSNTIAYGTVDNAGKLTRLEKFEAPYSAMAHDFLVTRNYLLFPILPLVGSLERATRGSLAYAWEPEKGGYVGVVRRDASPSTMRWFRLDPCYVYHGMNAYEDGDRIIAHVMQYEAPPFFGDATGKPLDPTKTVARLHRWTFDLAAKSDDFKRERIDDLSADFPRLDERFSLNPYRHGFYAATEKKESVQSFDILAHSDFKTGKLATYSIPKGDAFSEPVFVPRSADAPEGDGYLLATIYRRAENRSDLAIFNCATLADGPIAVAELSHRVTLGFHGNWLGTA
jgi:carotenoid cleavage dioxygenase-like enzyme